MFSPFNEVLAQSRIDQFYSVEIPAAELRAQAQQSAEPPQLRPSQLRRLGRRVFGSLRHPRGVVTSEPAAFD